MIDSFDGDVALVPTPDGGFIEYVGGQPRMDAGGLENAVSISYFTDRGWPGNALDKNQPAKQIGSDFEEAIRVGAITAQKLINIERAGAEALQWMIDVGIAVSAAVVATAPNLNRIDVDTLITKPDGATFGIRYELNWIAGIMRPVKATVK